MPKTKEHKRADAHRRQLRHEYMKHHTTWKQAYLQFHTYRLYWDNWYEIEQRQLTLTFMDRTTRQYVTLTQDYVDALYRTMQQYLQTLRDACSEEEYYSLMVGYEWQLRVELPSLNEQEE